MTTESVDIYIKNHNPAGDPIAGVVVKVMNVDGTAVHFQATSDVNGVASGMLPAPATYQVRFYKFGVSFSNPLFIEMLENETNSFNVYGELYVPGQSVDPRLCTASGYFRRPNGDAHKWLDMHFIAKFDPILLDGAGMLGERVTTRTNEQGFASISLVRFGQYDVLVEGMENIYRTVSVPDAAAVNLPDLLIPVVKDVVFDVVLPLELAVGEEREIPTRVFTTALQELTQLGSDVSWSLSDPSKANFEVRTGAIWLKALNPGVVELRAARKDQTIVRIPNTPIGGAPLSLTIT